MEADIPGPASPSDPTQDQPGKTAPVPKHIVFLLHGARILLGYGQHLLDTIRHRATAPTFPTIASCFGTANLATILAHLNRGILRAAALERFLLARAATGRDIEMVTRRIRADDEPPPAPTDQPAEPKATPRPSLPPGWDNPELVMPTPEELDRQVRRRSIGRTFAEICNDLGVVPEHCASAFWNGMFEIMNYFGGNGVITVMREKTRRVHAFIQEQDKKLDSAWDWLHLKRDEIRERLGFFIGEEPVDPFATIAAPATGPP